MSDVLTFVARDSYNNVSMLADQVAGFGQNGNGYEVFLKGGGSILIRMGQYEYETLTRAMMKQTRKETK